MNTIEKKTYHDSLERRTMKCPTGVYLEFDPLGAYPDLTNGALIFAVGILPQILSGYYGYCDTFKKNAIEGYFCTSGFEPCWSNDLSAPAANIDDDGLYHFPDDPPRSPCAVLYTENEYCFIYESGFIAVRDNGKWIVARLD